MRWNPSARQVAHACRISNCLFLLVIACFSNPLPIEYLMNILVVHAHHEPESFCSALASQAIETLQDQGHQVVVSDLYRMNFDPVSDRRNFRTTKDSAYLKQQSEEVYATAHDGFANDVEIEIQKLESADAIIFSFPLWWFAAPAILKGWCDRVLAAGRVYGRGKLYENGIGSNQKRALVIMTTGARPESFDGWGINPPMEHILAPIQHGVFWFNGFRALDPFIAWAPARVSDEDRVDYLRLLKFRVSRLFEEPVRDRPNLADFPDFGSDTQDRFMVVLTLKPGHQERLRSSLVAKIEVQQEWSREGVLLDFQTAEANAEPWKAFFLFRARDQQQVQQWLSKIPVRESFDISITKLARPSDG